MSERIITTRIINRIFQEGNTSFAIKYHGTATTLTGVPDLIGAFRGVPFAVEVKKPEELEAGLTLAQRAYLNVFGRGGYVTGVISSIAEFEKLFDKTEKVLYPNFKR